MSYQETPQHRSLRRAGAPVKPYLQAGQSTMEYVVMCAVLAFVLFVPVKDSQASPDQARTTVQILLNIFQTAYQNFSYAISLPS